MRAITKPSADVTLAFVRPGLVAKVLVKEDDFVQAGQALVQQDDEAERAKLEQLKAEAEDDVKILAAEGELKQKQNDLEKYKGAEGATTVMEVEHVRLEVTIAELRVRLAKFERAQARRQLDEMQVLINRMRLVSPCAGKVEKIFVKEGEAVDGLAKVVRVVNVNPLWAEGRVSTEQCKGLGRQRPAKVQFPGGQTGDGEVIRVSSVAEPVSETMEVRVSVPNPTSRPAGENVSVVFTAPPASAPAPPAAKSDPTPGSPTAIPTAKKE